MIISPLQDENLTGNGTRVVTAAPGPLTTGLPLMYDADGNAVPTQPAAPPHPVNYPVNVPFDDTGFTEFNTEGGATRSFSGDIFVFRRTNVVPNDFALYLKPLPAYPYRIWTRLLTSFRLFHSDQLAGLAWYDEISQAAMIFSLRGDNRLAIYGMSKITPTPQFSSFYDSALPRYAEHSGALALGLEGDGIKKRMVFCPTLRHSRTFIEFDSAQYITPTHAGLMVGNGVGGGETALEVLSFGLY